MFLAGTFVFGSDIEDAIRVNIERHFNLRHAAWCWRNAVKYKATQALVVIGEFALTLQDVDLHLRLVVGSRREYFALAGRYGGIALD